MKRYLIIFLLFLSVILTISGCGKTYEFPLKPVDDSLTYPSNNQIWYTSSDGQVIEMKARRFSEATPLTNHYKDGKGVITFDKDVNEIGEWAFGYTLLKSIIIPESVTQIEDKAFCGCENLTNITIPQSVTQIEDKAFAWCQNLTTIYCMAITPPTLDGDIFKFSNNVSKIYVPKESVRDYKNDTNWSKYASSIVGYDF